MESIDQISLQWIPASIITTTNKQTMKDENGNIMNLARYFSRMTGMKKFENLYKNPLKYVKKSE